MADAKKIIVAIDGAAGSGKSTLARALAARLGYTFIDTGAMYRCVALAATRRKVNVEDKQALSELAEALSIQLEQDGERLHVYLDGEEVDNAIRSPEISRLTSSKVANVPGVRDAMVKRQRAMGARGGVVMEGRDIGTEVFPQAELKVFFVVSPEERARRRMKDFDDRGIAYDPEKVLAELHQRDEEDTHRPRGALKKAEDSIVIQGDGKDIPTLVDEILGHIPAVNN